MCHLSILIYSVIIPTKPIHYQICQWSNPFQILKRSFIQCWLISLVSNSILYENENQCLSIKIVLFLYLKQEMNKRGISLRHCNMLSFVFPASIFNSIYILWHHFSNFTSNIAKISCDIWNNLSKYAMFYYVWWRNFRQSSLALGLKISSFLLIKSMCIDSELVGLYCGFSWVYAMLYLMR